MKSSLNGYPFISRKKRKRKKTERIRDNGFSINSDNGASLMLVGLAAFFYSFLHPLEGTSVPPPPRHALRLISWLRKSPRDNRDFILRRVIRAGTRSSRILSAFFFINIGLSPSFLLWEGGVFEHNGTFERKECIYTTPCELRENELNCGYENDSNIRKDLRNRCFVTLAEKNLV